VVDLGDVAVGPWPQVPTRDPVSLVIEPGGLARMVGSTRAAVGTALDSGLLPLVVGGDCPLLLGCLGAVADRAGPPSLLFVDGHEDAYGPAESPTGEAADMELGFLLGRHALPPGVSAPVLDPAAVAILGARDGRPLREDGVATLRGVVPFWDDAALASDPEGMTRRALAAIRQPWWFHVDLDVLSPSPAVCGLPAARWPRMGRPGDGGASGDRRAPGWRRRDDLTRISTPTAATRSRSSGSSAD
jgi:arginase